MVLSPDAAKVRFGDAVRQFRGRAGLTQSQVSRASFVSQTMLSAIERGAKQTKRDHIERIEQALSTDGELLRLWDSMFTPDGLSPYFRNVAELEREADQIRHYELALIPGLLQTEGYARCITRIGQPKLTPTEIETQVAARLERQAALTAERGPLYLVVLDEVVLRRPIGGREIMREQLEHLIKVSKWSRVTLQVVPADTEYHPGLDGTFQLILVPGKGEILYTETRVAGYPVTDAEAVSDYTRVFGELRGASLPVGASRALLESALGAMSDG